MAKKKITKKDPEGNPIKIKIDHRTFITVRTEAALKMWLERYPNAKVETN